MDTPKFELSFSIPMHSPGPCHHLGSCDDTCPCVRANVQCERKCLCDDFCKFKVYLFIFPLPGLCFVHIVKEIYCGNFSAKIMLFIYFWVHISSRYIFYYLNPKSCLDRRLSPPSSLIDILIPTISSQ